MKTYILLVAAALTAGQQFQQTSEFNTAVRLAGPGFFERGDSVRTESSFNNNDQRKKTTFQSASSESQNQGDNFINRFFGGSRSSSPSGSFESDNQFQSGRSSFQQNQQNNLRSVNSNNRNQFQNQAFQPSQQNAFSSNNFQQDDGNRFQSTSFVTSSPQTNNENRFQSNLNQKNSGSQFQTSLNRQTTASRLTPIDVQLTPSIRFQSTSNVENTGPSFQDSINQQNAVNRFQQSSVSQQNTGSNTRFSTNNQVSSGIQSQSNSLLRSSSAGSTSGDFSDNVNGVFEPLNLPSGASRLLGSISTSFNCIERPYGYYADQDNSCRVFHVCNPALFSNGEIQTYQYSFMCGEGTVFDQNEMTCMAEFEATPCQESSNFFFRNEQFGRIEDKSF